jgi:hypothetical protein
VASLYSKEMSQFIHSLNFPRELEWRIVEEETHLQFVLYRDNFEAFDGETKKHIAGLTRELMEKIRGEFVPIYLEVRAGNGKDD